ncbi:uncharacterized protein LOC130243458 [Danio aesculapii]|uniref:uncharacterized protein LOC130243458 n=1 Tax=Danio aesculapii TaxID=1142201 RepID=UPI0024C0A2EC|nr:uncharacterized protein LOC130243458 [Danio aesculapii]
MSRHVEVVINPTDQSHAPVLVSESTTGDPPGVTGFLKINPAALGWLEILTGGAAFGLVFWNYERMLLIPACFLILVGVITATAACTRNPCLVVTSQALNLLNIFSAVAVIILFFILFYLAFSIRVFLAHPLSPKDMAFISCNVLGLVFSLIIFATSCCWCKSRKRLMVIHMSPVPPAVVSDDVVDHPRPVFSLPAYSPVPTSEPPAYEDERRSTLSRSSAPRWDKRRWIEDLQNNRRPLQV